MMTELSEAINTQVANMKSGQCSMNQNNGFKVPDTKQPKPTPVNLEQPLSKTSMSALSITNFQISKHTLVYETYNLVSNENERAQKSRKIRN